MDWETFNNQQEFDKKKNYDNILTQLNELKNKCEILKMDKSTLEEENKKLFEINVNSIPSEIKIEIDEKINNMTEELRKQKSFLENAQKMLDEKNHEKIKIEQQLSDEISRLNKQNQELEYELDDSKRKNRELSDLVNDRENGSLKKISEQELIIEELIGENSTLMIDLYEWKKKDFLIK